LVPILIICIYPWVLFNEYDRTKNKEDGLKFIPDNRKFSYILRVALKKSPTSIKYFPVDKIIPSVIKKIKYKLSYTEYLAYVPKKYWDITHVRVSCYREVCPFTDVELLKQKILDNPKYPYIGKRLFDRHTNLEELFEHVLTGFDFNYYMNKCNHKLTKLLWKSEIHYNVNYSGGGKFIDPLKFYPLHVCSPGGMYFTIDNKDHIQRFSKIHGKTFTYKRSVTIPNTAFVYFEMTNDNSKKYYKFKTNEFILGERELIKN
jgi:hypothetical protein